jgi:predicted dehydrogenase
MGAQIRTGVVGVGYFGSRHATKLAELPNSNLTAVADHDSIRAQQVASAVGAKAFTDHRDLFGRVDAVSIAVPTADHFQVTKDFLEHGVHVLVEKPMTSHVERAAQLVAIADRHGLVLQVGHLERFSAAYFAVQQQVTDPLYIEARRIAPFRPRGTDVSVVFDLMIHDIDLVLALVRSPLVSVDAVGTPVLSENDDIANTRLRFANGCFATITASRVSGKTERSLRIFERDSYLVADLVERKIVRKHKGNGEIFPGIPEIEQEQIAYGEGDSLKLEMSSFLNAVATKTRPVVDGRAGLEAVRAATMINESLAANCAPLRQRLA